MIESGHISTFCARFPCKGTFITQSNTWVFISNATVNGWLIKQVIFWFSIAWEGFRIESTLATVMTGDPSDVLETVAFIVELYCHVMVGAGLTLSLFFKKDTV